jgi:hypothetical protein
MFAWPVIICCDERLCKGLCDLGVASVDVCFVLDFVIEGSKTKNVSP